MITTGLLVNKENELRESIRRIIAAAGTATVRDIVEGSGISESTVRFILQNMKEEKELREVTMVKKYKTRSPQSVGGSRQKTVRGKVYGYSINESSDQANK